MDSTIPNNLISLPGFHEPLHRHHSRHGGGCLIYISQILYVRQKTKIQSELFENISVDVRVNNVKLSSVIVALVVMKG